MPSRSSRSRPASLTSVSEPTGSASRAIAIRLPSRAITAASETAARTVTTALRQLAALRRRYARLVGKASDWLREERRKVLGDWVAFCRDCGSARRWFEEFEAELP